MGLVQPPSTRGLGGACRYGCGRRNVRYRCVDPGGPDGMLWVRDWKEACTGCYVARFERMAVGTSIGSWGLGACIEIQTSQSSKTIESAPVGNNTSSLLTI